MYIYNVHNYADDTTLSAFSNSVPRLIKLLEKETDETLTWLNNNNMIANPKKFHSIILSRGKNSQTITDNIFGFFRRFNQFYCTFFKF